ncbi:unnamed protein product, partial [Musa acuminata subsp. burmannicoides]
QSNTSDPDKAATRPPYCSTPYRSASDTPEPFRKTRDDADPSDVGHPRSRSAKLGTTPHGVDPYGSVNARLQGIGHPFEELTAIKGPRTIDRPIACIKANPLTNE